MKLEKKIISVEVLFLLWHLFHADSLSLLHQKRHPKVRVRTAQADEQSQLWGRATGS